MNKPNCYKCKYRGSLPGDTHSICKHPSLGNEQIEIFLNMIIGKQANTLNIRGDTHGIEKGWFMWPANFDPIWLNNCDGFKSREEK
ncbi:MAG: hypothetical protein A2381_19370 [Bdellovibrionales bacterium RIFOXYB1_FULL_37_110]|nr:MAG: hypothetical protein A2381_19370 [Bdellovibrionales bacterium RIFOXYB1_FULL_37_110]